MIDVLISQAADDEYVSALKWYAERSSRAAGGFDLQVDRAVRAIAASPELYPKCDEHHRYYLLKRYPFQIIYRRLSNDSVLIVAIAHTSRRPGYWLSD